MARVQYGTIVTEVKGKVQGQVFQGGNIGFVLRNKGYTKGLSTFRRSTANSFMVYAATQWKTLNDAQRQSWIDQAPYWPFYNKFGAPYVGSGFQVFMAYNTYKVQFGDTEVTPSAPAVVTPPKPGVKVVTYSIGSGLVLSWDNETDVDTWIDIFASAPVSQGKNDNYPRLKKLATFFFGPYTELDLTSLYTPVFGVPSIGQRVIIRSIFREYEWQAPYFQSNNSAIVTA